MMQQAVAAMTQQYQVVRMMVALAAIDVVHHVRPLVSWCTTYLAPVSVSLRDQAFEPGGKSGQVANVGSAATPPGVSAAGHTY